MKKAFFLILFIFQSMLAAAQLYVDGKQLDASNSSNYLEVIPMHKEDGPYYLAIDYGQKPVPGAKRGDFLTDQGGRRFEFRSVVDGLNFLYENGWEVSEVYVFMEARRYLMRRR